MRDARLLIPLLVAAIAGVWWAASPADAPVGAAGAPGDRPIIQGAIEQAIGVPATELGFVPPPLPVLAPPATAPLPTTVAAGSGWVQPAPEPPPDTPVQVATAIESGSPAMAAAEAGQFLDEHGQAKAPTAPLDDGPVYLDEAGRAKPTAPVADAPFVDHLGRPKVAAWIDPMGDARYAEPVAVTGDAPVDTSAMPSNVERHDPVTGEVLPPDAPPPSVVEVHVDGAPADERAVQTTRDQPAIATEMAPEAPVDPALYAETVTAAPEVPTWDGPGTDTRAP